MFSRTINKKNENVSLEQTKINTNANIDTPKTINVESITLDKENVVMGTGETVKLNKQITPSNATTDICWSSSDNSIATVVDGNINAIKEGEIIISISSGEVIANCKVKVVKNKKEQIEEENKKYNEKKKKINDSYDSKIRSTEAEIRLLKSEGYYYGTYSQYRSEVLSLSKEITNLEKSWAAYEYDNSEENRYKKNQIKTNLANARRELSELEDSYANKQSIELYESLLDSFEVNRKSELTKLENTHTLNIEKINKLY